MKKATVTFIKYHTYEIEISDEIYNNGNGWDAIEIAEEKFKSDMRSPIADISYDDVEIEFEEEDENEDL